MSATMMIAAVRLELICLRLAYDIKPQISSMVDSNKHLGVVSNDATRAVVEPPMYYCIIGRYAPPLMKRKWLRNEFCSDCGKDRTDSWQH